MLRRMFKVLVFCVVCCGAVCAKEYEQIARELLANADVEINGSRPWDIQVHNPDFYARVLSGGSLGLGESYMEGWWDCAQLDECICRIVKADLSHQVRNSWSAIWGVVCAKLMNQQTKQKSMEVIDGHYQIGNDLFVGMLDGLMTYSCGYWDKSETLDDSQRAKYELIAQKMHLKPGMRVLDIGCGWGGFAKYLASYHKVQVVGVTLSENQAELAREMCAGLPVEIRVQDYRDVNEPFDRIVEIGMFEHVGSKNYREFMEIVHKNLKDQGLFMLHTIGKNHTTVGTDPWIHRYIFPNGHIPSIAEISKSIENLFVMEDWHNFGVSYDKTLMAWSQNFDNHWPKIQAAYSPTYYRMWQYYLQSCAGAFRARELQLWQVVLSKGGVAGGYKSVR